MEAATRACEVVDECVGRLVKAVVAKGGVVVLTADHGNAERMIHPVTHEPHTSHTVGPVTLFLLSGQYEFDLKMFGVLADVAPTICQLLDVEPSPQMTGESLILGWREKIKA